MPEVSEKLVLHALRLAGVVPAEVVGDRLGTSAGSVMVVLEQYADRGLVSHHSGRLTGWSLTPSGRVRGESLLGEELAAAGAEAPMAEVFGRFLSINRAVLDVCTDWQVVNGSRATGPGAPESATLNGHNDPAYDAEVLARLRVLHGAAIEVLDMATDALDRFDRYGPRLGNALARAESGDVDWVTRPVIDSYHTVWFELHEDLLATLGRRRGDDVDGASGRLEATGREERR